MVGILYVMWIEIRNIEFYNVLNINSTDVSNSLSVLDIFVYCLLDSLLSNSWTEIPDVVIMELVRFMQVKNHM